MFDRGRVPRKKKYLHESKGAKIGDVWTDTPPLGAGAKERTGYPTQKPLALLRRIIEASSAEGDMVLDPFCGCATTCIAAAQLNRRWVGIDISAQAAKLVDSRMRSELGLHFDGVHRRDIPRRSDLGKVRRYNSAENREKLYGAQGGYCLGCRAHFQARHMTVDHIIPRSKGGTDHLSNLQLLCAACNSLKGDRPQAELIVRLTDKGFLAKEAPAKRKKRVAAR